VLTLTAAPYALPLSRPLTTARGAVVARRGWRVALWGGAGRVGVGEAACWPGFGGGEELAAGALAALAAPGDSAAPLAAPLAALSALRLHDPHAPVSLAAVEAACAAVPSPEARHALELAALDLRAQALGAPLAALLAGRPLAPHELAAHTHALVSDAEGAARALDEGYGAVKLKVGAAPHWTHDAMEAARVAARLGAAGGARAGLRLDANGAWGAEEARAFCVVAGALGAEWVEEPLRAGAGWGAWRAAGAAGAAPLAADESAPTLAAVEEAVALGGARVVTLKPMFLGGLLPALRAAERAAALGARVCVTHALESSVGRRGAAHLCAALAARGLAPAGGLGGALDGDPAPAAPARGGRVLLDAAPGLGDLPRARLAEV